jgi:hypothetical protein
MKVKTVLWSAALGLGLYFTVAPIQAENARLPYHQIYSVQKAQAELNRTHTNLLILLVMQPTSPDVKISDLKVYIDSKSGPIPIVINTLGDFVIPMRDDLLAEDPWLITNQPRGTMRLSWKMGLMPGPMPKSIHYAKLMRPLRDCQDVQDEMRQLFPGTQKATVAGLKFTFPRAEKRAVITIHSREGERTLEANDNSEITVPLISDLIEEDPEISLSTSPAALEIVSHPTGE